jgi:hypothetical protein
MTLARKRIAMGAVPGVVQSDWEGAFGNMLFGYNSPSKTKVMVVNPH